MSIRCGGRKGPRVRRVKGEGLVPHLFTNTTTLELTVRVCAKWELRSQKVFNGAHKALLQHSF